MGKKTGWQKQQAKERLVRYAARNAEMKQLHAEGKSYQEIAEYMGLTVGRVREIAGPPAASRNPERDARIKELYASGMSGVQIGYIFGLSAPRVRFIAGPARPEERKRAKQKAPKPEEVRRKISKGQKGRPKTPEWREKITMSMRETAQKQPFRDHVKRLIRARRKDEQNADVVTLRRNGLTLAEIGKRLGISYQRVWKILKYVEEDADAAKAMNKVLWHRRVKGSAPAAPPKRAPDGGPLGRITPTRKEAIRQRLLAGEGTSLLAREYGVSPSRISKIKRGVPELAPSMAPRRRPKPPTSPPPPAPQEPRESTSAQSPTPDPDPWSSSRIL